MPIFFHLASHIWIFYLFIANGFLIHLLLRNASSHRSSNYLEMTAPIEASLLASFFLSLSLNSCLLLILDLANQSFSLMKGMLPAISFILSVLVYKSGISNIFRNIKFDFGWCRLLLYSFVFLILFYNGGLIEQTADSWWHMSLANKIGIASSFSLEMGHLTGDPTRYYPPLWHANLALANVVSAEPIPVFWNSFTAWGGVLKVMSFYLFTLALSANRSISVLSALLFVFLPGMGDSYLRVSAWPSHIAYTAMFYMFYLCFGIISSYRPIDGGTIVSVYKNLMIMKSALLGLFGLALIIMFVHQLELLWFFIGMLVYLSGLVVSRFFGLDAGFIENKSNDLVAIISIVLVFMGLGVAVYALISDWRQFRTNIDWLVISFAFIVLFITLLSMAKTLHHKRPKNLSNFILVCFLISVIPILLGVDIKHLLSLIIRDLAYPSPQSHEWPLLISGYFGGELKLPSWDLQLRSALLYTGILSIPISVILLVVNPSRLTLFVSANAIVAILVCLSPYLYLWLSELLNYHSPWRIAVLIFHPIILAATMHLLWNRAFKQVEVEA